MLDMPAVTDFFKGYLDLQFLHCIIFTLKLKTTLVQKNTGVCSRYFSMNKKSEQISFVITDN
jgi:hypothetical protein